MLRKSSLVHRIARNLEFIENDVAVIAVAVLDCIVVVFVFVFVVVSQELRALFFFSVSFISCMHNITLLCFLLLNM